jgi:hypothetical protein
MLYREVIAVCSQIHTKHINTLCEQNVLFVSVKPGLHIVCSELQRVNNLLPNKNMSLSQSFVILVYETATLV